MKGWRDKESVGQALKKIIYGDSETERYDRKDKRLIKKIDSIPFNKGVETENAVM